jgi:2-methylcitrate dehydratase PrpD
MSSSATAALGDVPAKLSAGFTDRIIDSVFSIDVDALRPDLLERARHCLLDWTGVTLAGSTQETASITRGIALSEGGSGTATVLGTTLRLGPQGAAFANGIASHALDFDDSSIWAAAHASGPMVAALLAHAEQRGSSGGQVLEAIVAGLQGQCYLGIATGGGPYEKGFHTTGTMGAFGATIATAFLLGLDREQFARALSLAATQAAGLKSVFGTMGKHLNTAKAAMAGVLSTQLAEAGFTAPVDAIEARLGFEWTQSTTFDPDEPERIMGDVYGVESVFFKYFACCHDTHSAMQGIFDIRTRRPFEPGEVARVELGVPAGLMDICGIPEPTTGLEGKFSVRYACSRALAQLDLGIDGFTDEEVNRADLLPLRALVDVIVTNDGSAVVPTDVTVHFTDGSSISSTIDPLVAVPRAQLDQQWSDLSAKFLPLASSVLGTEQATALYEAIAHLETLDDIAEFTGLAVAR